MELLSQTQSFSLNGMRPVLTVCNPLPPTRTYRQGSVINSQVGPGCVIKGHVENSVLSPGVWIEEEVLVRNSVIMADTFIGHHSVVDQCILGEGININRWCYLGFGDTVISGERGITLLGDRVMVPPYTAIGRNCKILPDTGPEDFSRKVVPANSTVPAQPVARLFPIFNEREEVLQGVYNSSN